MDAQARAKVESVAHLHAVDENIDLPVMPGTPEEKALVAMQRVEGRAPLVAKFRKKGSGLAAIFPQRHEIQIFICPLKAWMRSGAGTQEVDGKTAKEAENDAFSIGGVKDTSCFLGYFENRAGRTSCLIHEMALFATCEP